MDRDALFERGLSGLIGDEEAILSWIHELDRSKQRWLEAYEDEHHDVELLKRIKDEIDRCDALIIAYRHDLKEARDNIRAYLKYILKEEETNE